MNENDGPVCPTDAGFDRCQRDVGRRTDGIRDEQVS